MLFNKLLKISFILFLFIIFGEVGFLFGNQLTQSSQLSKNQIVLPTPTSIVSDLNPIQQQIFQKSEDFLKQSIEASASGDQLDILFGNLLYLQKHITTQSHLTNNFEGNISSINTDKRTMTVIGGPTSYVFTLFISHARDKDPTGFYFTQDDLKLLSLYKLIDEKEVQINYSDLKVGDSITLNGTFDLLTGNLIKLKIVAQP